MTTTRKKSPRAPSMSLSEALDRATAIYDKEGRHTIPNDVAAHDMGYASGKSGAALGALSTLKAFGLLESPSPGKVSVSKTVEEYKFSPTEEHKQELRSSWLMGPKIYSDLLERYSEGLPSDATLKYTLIEQGFKAKAADSVLKNFRESVRFANYDSAGHTPAAAPPSGEQRTAVTETPFGAAPRHEAGSGTPQHEVDRIPVRLSGGRRAWIEIPVPFYDGDKKVIKAQVDLIITDEEKDDGDDD